MAKMSFKNKLALIGIPLLIVALAAAVYISQTATSTETKASTGSASCESKCRADFKNNPNNLDRCLKTCEDWRLGVNIRPLFCTLASSAITTLGQPENKTDYTAVRDNIRTSLESTPASGAAKLKKEMNKFGAADTKSAYKKYCIERSNE